MNITTENGERHYLKVVSIVAVQFTTNFLLCTLYYYQVKVAQFCLLHFTSIYTNVTVVCESCGG